ncbi:MAG: DinB family protein [Chitinophagaceae bacterium]
MLLQKPIQNVFVQLTETLNQMSDAEYTQQSRILFNASIGQHVRHIIELFLCLEQGYKSGVVNYEKRKRDYEIETNKDFAVQLLKDIYQRIDRPDAELVMETENYEDPSDVVMINSNYYREIAYNLEHTIHHMALIRVGINEVSSIQLPDEFGVAYSTIKFRQQCAQ